MQEILICKYLQSVSFKSALHKENGTNLLDNVISLEWGTGFSEKKLSVQGVSYSW